VSGFSSGGCFATQFHTAFSKSVYGVGSFAGAPYLSFWSSTLQEDTLMLAGSGLIDPVENMKDDKIFIFQGINDTITPWYQGKRIKEFYQNFTSDKNIVLKDDINVEHGVPSDKEGGPCPSLNSPYYINNCNYSGAHHLFKNIFGEIYDGSSQDQFILRDFNQNEFFDDNDANKYGLDDNGYIFIPSECGDGIKECHLHVHFHGCNMESGLIGDGYIQTSGLLSLGEANNIVMLFPQIKHDVLQGNPYGCWDWWGYLGLTDYTGYNYATKHGEQMAGVTKMIEKVANISMF